MDSSAMPRCVDYSSADTLHRRRSQRSEGVQVRPQAKTQQFFGEGLNLRDSL